MDDIPTLEKDPTLEKRSLSPVVGFAVASALGAMLIVLLAHRFGLLGDKDVVRAINTVAHVVPQERASVTAAQLVPVVPPLPANLPPVDSALETLVAQGVAQLGLTPKTVTLPNEQALQEVAAIKRGDYAAAATLARDVLDHSSLDGWHFTPFTRFMGSLTHGNDPELLDHLNQWVKQQPQSALAYLVRGQYYYVTAWTLRTASVGWKIPHDIYSMFEEDLRLSEVDLRESIRLNPNIPWSYLRLLTAVSGNGNSKATQAVFEMAIKAHPQYYELYRYRLYMLTPKWDGSINDMYAFAEKYASRATNRSPLKLLYLQVYAYLMDAAWYDCSSRRGDAAARCVVSTMKWRYIPQDVKDGIVQALNLYKVSDPVAFSNAIWPVFSDIAAIPGSSSAGFGEMLQTAATIMGSDNRLANASGHNSYVLDDVTAQIWAQIGNNDNVDQKYHDALADIEKTTFREEADRDEALATVLDHMANFSRNTSQLTNIIIYYDAAVSVGGVNFTNTPHQKCYAYYKMKRWTEAVTECTRVLETNNHYLDPQEFLARSYEGLQQWDTALAIHEPVALSADNSFRVGAAIGMSVDYGHKNDFAGELKSLNEHAFVFNTRMQEADDLAVVYNNRCHALMELGRLQEALDDCNVSLKYGQLPEAIRKQQELLRRLAQN
jgi:tetratricopeptide (TPR) repeat protein